MKQRGYHKMHKENNGDNVNMGTTDNNDKQD